MKQEITDHINDPASLEKLYRSDKSSFKKEFNLLYPELKGTPLAEFWHERLSSGSTEINWGTRGELTMVVLGVLFCGLIAKLPAIFGFNDEFFYPRNIGFIVFPALIIYFGWKNGLTLVKTSLTGGAVLLGLIYINLLPDNQKSDTLVLSCIHLLLFLWSITGISFIGNSRDTIDRRLNFLRYNGDLVVMSALIVIAGLIMSGITVGLFRLIGLNIAEFYFQNIAVIGISGVPLAATYLTRTNPQLVGKVSPVIAKIFSPLVLVMLITYLAAIFYSGKDPYNDREFLMVFNALLIGVMALIFFSAAEMSGAGKIGAETWVLFILSAITIIVNGIALSAIVFRIAELGITPNRAAVLGSNILILVNLLLVTAKLFLVVTKRTDVAVVGRTIALYLPVYAVWAIVVTFLFPLIFSYS